MSVFFRLFDNDELRRNSIFYLGLKHLDEINMREDAILV